MSNDDEITKPDRKPIQYSMSDLLLQKLRERLIDANDLIVVNELRNFLIEQQRQDIAIEELRGVVQTLSAGMVATIEHVNTLQRAVLSLTSSRDEMLKKQEAIAKMCDALAESIDHRGETR